MKPTIPILTLFLSGILFQKSNLPSGSDSLEEKSFSLSVEQYGVILPTNNHSVTLQKDSFDLVFEFSEPMAVLVNASLKNKSLKLASQGAALDKLPGFEE